MTTTAVPPHGADPRPSTGADRKVGPVLAWVGLVLVMVARGYRAFVVTLILAAAVPMLWSWTSYVVKSGSMQPSLEVGDVVIGKPHPSGDPIPVGRIMVFDNPIEASSHPVLVHRVVEDLGDGLFTTAGDANDSQDATPVPTSAFTDRAVIRVPYIARPLVWLASHDIVPLLLWAAVTALAFYFSARPPCDPRHRRRREAKRARRAAARAAAVLRRTAVPIGGVAALVVAWAFGALPAQADAAFTSTTTSAANTWTASTSLAQDVVLTDPGSVVRGTVPLQVTLANTGGAAYSVRIEYATAGTTNWKTLCTDATAPYSCSWSTAGFLNQDYDLRAVSISGSTTHVSDTVDDVLVDNAAPSVTMQNPGTPLRGVVTLSASATDVHSGIDDVVIQHALAGSSIWREACSITDQPFSCQFDTTTIASGTYSFRAVARDVAGNTTTSTAIGSRVVDNTVSSVSMNDPGANLSGVVNLTANASSTGGVTSVRIQRATSGSSTWTDICTDTSSPYTCSWNTTQVTSGLYDLRAVLLDGTGKTTTSAVVAGRRVDNSPLRAYDVQTTNGGSRAGRFDAGDTITFTYNQEVRLSTISSGWTGTAMSVTTRLRDGNLLGLGSANDTVDVLRSGSAVNLGSVNLKQDYLKSNRTAQFAATMTASTTTVNGVPATRVVLVLGYQISGQPGQTVSTASTMVWTPSAVVTDLLGRAVSTTPASESGPADREF